MCIELRMRKYFFSKQSNNEKLELSKLNVYLPRGTRAVEREAAMLKPMDYSLTGMQQRIVRVDYHWPKLLPCARGVRACKLHWLIIGTDRERSPRGVLATRLVETRKTTPVPRPAGCIGAYAKTRVAGWPAIR